jgi:hypothetical protein
MGGPRVDISLDWLKTEYEDKERSTRDIASELGCSSSTIWYRLKQYQIPIRSIGEAISGEKHPQYGKRPTKDTRRRMSTSHQGARHHNWRGGVSFGKYCPKFNRRLKEGVRDRFDRVCFICGAPENGSGLDVHHVDYNKGQGCGAEWNLIPLCKSCHSKTNWNRWYWFSLLSTYWAENPEINFNMPR